MNKHTNKLTLERTRRKSEILKKKKLNESKQIAHAVP